MPHDEAGTGKINSGEAVVVTHPTLVIGTRLVKPVHSVSQRPWHGFVVVFFVGELLKELARL